MRDHTGAVPNIEDVIGLHKAKEADTGIAIDYGITQEMIAALKARHAALTADTPEGYKAVSLAVKEVSGVRIAVERLRVEKKAASLAYGRAIDDRAKQWTALILEIETPLREKKDAVDNERQRKLEAIKAEEDRKLQEAENRRRQEAEARQKAEQDAERERNRLESERLAKERAELNAERERQAQQQRDAQAKIDAERADLDRKQAEAKAALDAMARAEQERKDAEYKKARRELFAKQESEQAERRAAAAVEAERQEQERLEKLKPDAEKLHDFAKRLRAVGGPASPLVTDDGRAALANALESIAEVAIILEAFGVSH